MNSDSPIFIVGCPRSGTSLLRNLLRSHPSLALPDESHFIPAYYKGYGNPGNASQARRLAADILRLEWVRSWELDLTPGDFEDCRTFKEVVCRLFEAWARKEGKRRWGDKTPHYVTQIPVLLEVFPSARILHIIRDGRDVALSWLRTRMEPRNLYMAARFWKESVTAGREAGSRLSSVTYMEVRYEALLTEPETTMRAVCDFVGESYDEAVLRPTPGSLNKIHPKALLLRRKEIVQTNAGKWKTQMPAADRVLFESVAGDLLAELGYETEGQVRRITTAERWMWTLHHYGNWVTRRLESQMLRTRLAAFLRIKGAERRARWPRGD